MCMRERRLKSVWFHASPNPIHWNISIVDHMATNHALPIICFKSNNSVFLLISLLAMMWPTIKIQQTTEKLLTIFMWCVYVYLFSVWPNAKLIRFWPLWRGEIHFRVRIYVANFVLICRIFFSSQLIWTVPSAPTNQPNQLTSLFFKWNRAKKKRERKNKSVFNYTHIFQAVSESQTKYMCMRAVCMQHTNTHSSNEV